jgi:hypothetical protein
MAAWFAHKMRLTGAIITIALYAFCATQIPATASTIHCSSRPCHEIVQSDADGSSGHRLHDGASTTGGVAKAALGGQGKAKNHANPGCQFSCSTGLSPEATPVIAGRSEVSIAFRALAHDPESRSPERLVRPPRIPFV